MAEVEESPLICSWTSCDNRPTICMSATVVGGVPGLFHLCDTHSHKLRRGQRFNCHIDGTIRVGVVAKMKGRYVADSFWDLDE